MSDPQGNDLDYLIARGIEDDNRPRNRAERRRERSEAKHRRLSARPKWVQWTLNGLTWLLVGFMLLVLIGWLTGWLPAK